MYVDEIRVQLAENRPQKQVQERLREYIVMFARNLSVHCMSGGKCRRQVTDLHLRQPDKSKNLPCPGIFPRDGRIHSFAVPLFFMIYMRSSDTNSLISCPGNGRAFRLRLLFPCVTRMDIIHLSLCLQITQH